MANTVLNAKDNFKVVIKSRPLIKRERDARFTSQWKINGDSIECINPLLLAQRYTFDHIYGEDSTTQELYDQVAHPIVQKSVQGFNGTIFAYGQTSSGKTYTMLGDKKNPGIIRLAARQIFSDIMLQQNRTFIVRVNYLEIYNEKVYDLLNDRKEIRIQELPNGELKFGCTGQKVQCEDETLKLVDAGNNHRRVAETNMNVQSSRSHAILQIGIESILECDGASQVSVLNLVDLAGSERADSTGATGERLKEAGNINKSLLTLSLVINKLSEDPDGHICYRDSKLTRMLQTSLGGNSMTVMICAITPAAMDETNLTLGFATRAKKIENKPVINETISDAIEVKRLKKTIVKLEEQLASQSKEIVQYQKKTNELKILKKMTIQAPKAPISASLRRKTWAPGTDLPLSIEENFVLPEINEDMTNGQKVSDLDQIGRPVCQLMFGDQGRQVQCTDDDWDSFMNDTIGRQICDFDEDESAPPTYKFPSRPQQKQLQQLRTAELLEDDHLNSSHLTAKTPNQPAARKSLLKTPISLKNILNKKNDLTPATSSLVASPIALDKDKRIRSLEEDLEELRHFQQTEILVQSANVESIKTEIDEKSVEIKTLHEKLAATLEQMDNIKSELESAQLESKEAKHDRAMALQAKVTAEQNMTSIEFKYEQHKARASRREKELVEQLDSLGNDDQLKVLKEKLVTMTEKVNSLETQLWNGDKEHETQIDTLNAKILEEHEKFKQVAKQADKLKAVQDEYDEVSTQLVDIIHENDQHKIICDDLKATIENLNKENMELKAQMSTANVNGEWQIELQKQSQLHAAENESLEQKHRDELQVELQKQSQLHASVKESLKQEHRDELDAELQNQSQLHASEKESLKQEHRDELEAELQKQSQLHVAEKESLEQKYRDELDAELQKQSQLHVSEKESLKQEHRDELDAELQKQSQLHASEKESLKQEHRDELEAELQKQSQLHVAEKESLEQKYRDELDAELQKQSQLHASEKESLKQEHRDELDAELQKQSQLHASEKESLKQEHRDELEAELQKQSQLHSSEKKSLKQKHRDGLEFKLQKQSRLHASEKVSLKQKYRDEFQVFQSHQVTQLADIPKLKQMIHDHSMEVEKLKEKHLDEVKDIRNGYGDHLYTLDQTISDQKKEMFNIKMEFNELLNDYKQLEHTNNLLQNVCDQARMTVDCLMKEIEVLRVGYKELQMNTAEQELEHLKLQKTINEYDDSINFSAFNETVSISLANNNQTIHHIREKNDEINQQLQKVNEERDALASQLTSVMERLSDISDEENSSPDSQIVLNQILDRTVAMCKQFKEIKEFFNFDMNRSESVIEIVRNRDTNNRSEIDSMGIKVKGLKEMCNQLESAKIKNEELTSKLKFEAQQLSEQLELSKANGKQLEDQLESAKIKNEELTSTLKCEAQQLSDKLELYKANEKQLKDQLENEKSSKVHLEQVTFELNQKLVELEEREKMLNQQTEELNDIKAKQRVEITRLQLMVTENTDVSGELAKVNKELDDVKAKLQKLFAESKYLKSDAESLKALLNEKENQLKENQVLLTEKMDAIVDLEKTIQLNHTELETLRQNISDTKIMQEEQMVHIKALEDSIIAKDSQKEELLNEIAIQKSMWDQHTDNKSTADEIRKQLIASEKQLNSANAEIAQLKNECEQIKKESQEKSIEKDRKMAELEVTIADCNRLKNECQKEFNGIQRELKDQLQQKEKEAKNLSNEIAELKEIIENFQRTNKDNQEKFAELQHKITVLEEEQGCLEILNNKLHIEVDSKNEEIGGVQRQLAIMKHSKEMLEVEKQKLVDEMSSLQSKRHAGLAGACANDSRHIQSPRRRDRQVDIDSLLNENRTLKSNQKALEAEVEDLRKNTSNVRKIKRQSIHDDTRRLSGFDSTMIDLGTQTDPVDEKCGCVEMAKQIAKLKQEIIIIEARYATFKMSTGVDDLKAEVKTLKTELLTTKTKLSRLNSDFDSLSDKHEKLKLKSVIAQQKLPSTNASMQTESTKTGATFVDQMDWERVNRRLEKYKKRNEELVNSYNQLKGKLEMVKSDLDQKSAKCIETAKLLEEIQPKYSGMKRICNHRWDQIEEFKKKIANHEKNEVEMKDIIETLKQELAGIKEAMTELTKYKRKYEAAKGICDSRRLEIERLNRLINDGQNNENVPVNHK